MDLLSFPRRNLAEDAGIQNWSRMILVRAYFVLR